MRYLPLALLLAAVCLFPTSASAWTHCGTPQAEADCPPITACVNGVDTQVPDNGAYTEGKCPEVPPTVTVCSNGQTITVPENQVPEGSSPGECVPPVETPPAVVVPPPAVEDVPPVVDQPNLVAPKEAHAHPHQGGIVAGKEQVNIGTPVSAVSPAEEATGTTLPFTGLPLIPLLLAGTTLGLFGYAARRALRA